MTPPRTPTQNRAITQAKVNELFSKNLEEIRRWFTRGDAGHDVGHNVLCGYVVSYVIQAWTCALEGKSWSPPAPTP